MKIKRQRKLIKKTVLDEAVRLKATGIPVAEISRQLNLTGLVSHPLISKLITYREQGTLFEGSLFPTWLDESDKAPDAQSTPLIKGTNKAAYSYIGIFPLGRWHPESR